MNAEHYDELYEFDAPKQYIDFSNFEDIDDGADEFFDSRAQAEANKAQELTCNSAKVHTSVEVENVSMQGDNTDKESDQIVCVPVDGVESLHMDARTDFPTQVKTTVASENIPDADMDVDVVHRPLTRSSRKGPLGNDGVFADPPLRHSPRLAAIAKALKSSPGKDQIKPKRRRSVSSGPSLRQCRMGGGSLSAEERSHLSRFAKISSEASMIRQRQSRQDRSKAGLVSSEGHIQKAVEDTAVATSAADFAKTLRATAKRSASVSLKPRGPTKPQPFNLSSNRKSSSSEGKQEKFVSLAELNMKFYCQTPQRFRTRSSKAASRENINASATNAGLTKPQSPYLSTSSRSRPINHPTREQLEEQELQEAIQKRFQSRPLNPKIFDPPKVPTNAGSKPATVPVPFNIKQTKKEISLSLASLEFVDENLDCVPHENVPTRTERHRTSCHPFSFDQRDKERFVKKQLRIEQQIADEKKLAEFHAHPMPVFEGGVKGLPRKKVLPLTKAQPFDLELDKRGQVRKEIFDKEMQEREQLAKQRAEFHARPAKVTKTEPFMPQPSCKPLTEIANFTLNTEKRSEERHDFDLRIKRKEDLILAEKREADDRQRVEEEARLAEERRRNVHRARPMPAFPIPQLQSSTKPATVPVSPKFNTDTRLRSARSSNSLSNSSVTSVGSR